MASLQSLHPFPTSRYMQHKQSEVLQHCWLEPFIFCLRCLEVRSEVLCSATHVGNHGLYCAPLLMAVSAIIQCVFMWMQQTNSRSSGECLFPAAECSKLSFCSTMSQEVQERTRVAADLLKVCLAGLRDDAESQETRRVSGLPTGAAQHLHPAQCLALSQCLAAVR